MQHVDTAIVGGGLSGLTVASQLHRADPQRTLLLLEASPRIGGAIDTTHVDGFTIDHGADMFAIAPDAALKLCRDIGCESELVLPRPDRRGAMIWSRGRMHAIPAGFVLMRATRFWPVIGSTLLSPAEKLRFALERFIRPLAANAAEESVGDFVRRRMGRGVLESLVAPLVAGIYTADIDRLSMPVAMAAIANLEATHGSLAAAAKADRRRGGDNLNRTSAGARYGNFRSFSGGMRTLVERIASSVPADVIQTSSAVQSLVRNENAWQLTTTDRAISASSVVLACPPSSAAKIVQSLDPDLSNRFAAIESASAAIVVLGVREDQIARPIDAFGFVVPPREGSPLIAASFASHKFDDRAPAGHVLIRGFVGGVLNPGIVDCSDNELIATVRGELSRMIGLRGDPVITRVIRWRSAMPQYNLGHAERIAAIRERLVDHAGLYWTSNADGGVGIAPTIGSAVDVGGALGGALAVDR